MASQSQLDANRDNSTLSTGPKTETGKNTAAQNATKHGLRGARVVLVNEDSNAYQALLAQLNEEHTPAGTVESALVTEIAANTWRLERARNIETELFDRQLLSADSAASDTPLADAFSAASAELDKIRRYSVAIERALYKALAELRKLQADRNAVGQKEAQAKREQKIRTDTFNKYFHEYMNAPIPGEEEYWRKHNESKHSGELASFGNPPDPAAATPKSQRK